MVRGRSEAVDETRLGAAYGSCLVEPTSDAMPFVPVTELGYTHVPESRPTRVGETGWHRVNHAPAIILQGRFLLHADGDLVGMSCIRMEAES